MVDCLMLDIGGTFVKYGAVQERKICHVGQFPVKENGSKEDILDPILDFLCAHPARRIAISMPGPMDYENGVSRMQHKFQAIFGVSLKAVIRSVLPDAAVCFLHDAAAYALGEMREGVLRDTGSGACVLLGTGLGFVLFRQGRVLLNEQLTPAGPLWNQPYRNGICEDYVSGRGIRRRYMEAAGETLDVREIAEKARAGDDAAERVFRETGSMLGEMLEEKMKAFPAARIAVGGQIARSLDLFLTEIQSGCSTEVVRAEHLDDAALRGAWHYDREGKTLFEVIS